MESAKPEFARRGAEKQRPKSWDKGTKSGSEKRKMREQGKREAREMNEEAEAFDPKTLDAASKRPFVKLGHGDNEKKYTASEYYAHLISQKIPHDMAVEHTNLSFGMDDGSSRMRNRSGGDYVNLRDPNTGRRTRIAGHDAYDAMKDEFYESIHHRLEKSLLEGWPDRESQREHAPHELAVPDNIADYESEEKLPHDSVHAEHYEDAMKNLKGSQDIGHAKNLVMRGAIGAALGRASIGNSKDPTLRHVMSILRGTQDALNDHFSQSQSESGIPFEEAVQHGLIPMQDAIVILETITEASFEDYQDEWKRAEDATHPDIPRGMQLSKLAGMFNRVVKKKTGEYKDRIKQTLTNDMKTRDVASTSPVRLNKQQSSFASQMGRSEAERQVPEYKALERRVNLAGAVYSKQADVSSAENEKFVSGLASTLKAKGLSGKVKVRVDRETGKYHVTDASGQTHMIDHYVFASTGTGLILESYYEIRK